VFAVLPLAACGGNPSSGRTTGDSASQPGRVTTSVSVTQSTATPSYRFVGDPVVRDLPGGGPPTTQGGSTAEIYVRLNRRLPGTGRFCALRVDGVIGEECERHRPLDARNGVCLHAYLGMATKSPLYQKGAGDRVRVRLDLNKNQGRLVRSVTGYGRARAKISEERIRELGCPR